MSEYLAKIATDRAFCEDILKAKHVRLIYEPCCGHAGMTLPVTHGMFPNLMSAYLVDYEPRFVEVAMDKCKQLGLRGVTYHLQPADLLNPHVVYKLHKKAHLGLINPP